MGGGIAGEPLPLLLLVFAVLWTPRCGGGFTAIDERNVQWDLRCRTGAWTLFRWTSPLLLDLPHVPPHDVRQALIVSSTYVSANRHLNGM